MRLEPSDLRQRVNEYGRERKPFFFMVDFELTEGYFLDNPLEQQTVFFSMRGKGNKPLYTAGAEETGLTVRPMPPEEYCQRFDVIREGLYNGESYLTNLTVRTEIDTPLSLETIFLTADAPYQVYLLGRFVCFSPERFVIIKDGSISTFPMKGTIDASLPDAEQRILSDFKETAEHHTIVDLLRNDLSMWARNVRVECFRYIDRITARDKEILQVSSEITGDLPADYLSRLGDIIFSMLPAGSVSGAPKAATVRRIRQAEKEPRGYYTGIAGYFDGAMFDSAVLIRFIEQQDGKLYFRSGGGITAYSRWEEEYHEILNKIYLPL